MSYLMTIDFLLNIGLFDFLDLLSFINLLCTCNKIYEKHSIYFKVWTVKKLNPLLRLQNKSEKESPYDFYKKNIHIVMKQLVYPVFTGNNFIKTYGPKSGLSRYRQHVLNNYVILPLLGDKYIEKTIHCSKKIVNIDYESDEYIDGDWIPKNGYNNYEPYHKHISKHYIIIMKKKY